VVEPELSVEPVGICWLKSNQGASRSGGPLPGENQGIFGPSHSRSVPGLKLLG
jgi:hypothetical protein